MVRSVWLQFSMLAMVYFAAAAGCVTSKPETAHDEAVNRLAYARLVGGTGPSAADRAAWAAVPVTHEITRAMCSGAGVYLADHPGACPTWSDLHREGLINSTTGERDAWGQAFMIECLADAVRVCSSGPDRRARTPDDVCAPRAALAF